jgi:hypothetical protein
MLPFTSVLLAAATVGPPAPPVLRAERTDRPPALDGRTDDAVWKKAAASSAFTQKVPEDGKAPSEPTTVRILYDDAAIYVAIDCVQKTSRLVAPLTRRDREVETDSVSVALATRGDGTTAFEFSISPSGVLADATRFDDTSSSRDWDENWEGRAATTREGWSAELKIPLRILRFKEKPAQSFGLQVRRYTSARHESDEWAYIPRADSGEVSRYGRLENLVGLKKGAAIEVRPFVLGKVFSRDTEDSPLSRGFSPGFSAGADFKWLALPSLTLDGAINPDFGQVEADKVVLNLSSYETYFPEKRPFFLEAADVFSTPMQLVYTRRIGHAAYAPATRDGEDFRATPDPSPIFGALKLTGTLGEDWSVGALLAVSGGTSAEVERDLGKSSTVTEPLLPYKVVSLRRVADPLSVFKVLRVRRNFSGGSHLGVIATAVSRLESPGDYPRIAGKGGKIETLCPDFDLHGDEVRVPLGRRCFHNAYAMGIDGKLRSPSGDYSLAAQAVGTLIENGPDRLQPDGNVLRSGDLSPSGKVQLNKGGGGHLRASATYGFHGKNADFNDLGYMQRQNSQSLDALAEYDTNGPAGRINDGFIGGYVWDSETLDFLSTGRGTGVFMGAQFKNFWRSFLEVNAEVNYNDDREIGDGAVLERAGSAGVVLELNTDERKPVILALSTRSRAYTNGAVSVSADATLKAQALPQLELELTPSVTYTAGEPRYYDLSDDGSAYLFGKLEAASLSATLSALYTFLPTLTLQVYGQGFMSYGRYTDFASFEHTPGTKPVIALSQLAKSVAPPQAYFADGTFNANVVVRWEYRLGSTVYLVYTHGQSDGETPRLRDAGRFNFKLVAPRAAADVLLLKVSYWWG